MLSSALILISLVATPLWTQKPAVEPPLAPSLLGFPDFGATVSPPLPVPQPTAGVPKLTPSLLFVFDAEVECLVLCSPPDVVKVAAEAGPVKYHGRFIEQPDKVQTKAFTRKFVYKVEPSQAGRCEVLIVAADAGKPSMLKRQLVDVDPGSDPVEDNSAPQAIRDAYKSETSPLKHSYAQMLAGFYRTRSPQYVKNFATWGDFALAMKTGRQALLDNEIPAVRRALEEGPFKTWPTDANKPMDARTALDSLNAAAAALEKLR